MLALAAVTLLVRERAPLRLAIKIATPSGDYARWGADDPDPRNAPQSLTFSSVMPGGFEQMSCVLERDPRIDYPDLEEMSTVTVHDPGGQVAWEGRLEDLPDTGGAQAQISPQCVGWQAHLDDDQAASMIYVDRRLSKWQQPSTGRQIRNLTGGRQLGAFAFQAAPDPTNGQPALIMSATYPWSGNQVCEAWYDAGPGNVLSKIVIGGTEQIASPKGVVTNVNPTGEFNVWFANDDLVDALDGGSLYPIGSAIQTNASISYRYAYLELINSGPNVFGSPASGDTLGVALANIALYGNHGLTLQGAVPYGLLASDIVAHAVSAWAPKLKFTKGSNGTILPSSFVVPQLAFDSPTTASEIVKQAVRFELLDWAVWESLTFYCNAMGLGSKTRNWRTRIGACQLQETGPQSSRIWNGVVVQYTDPGGNTRTVGPPGSGADSTSSSLLDSDPLNPANEAGLKRWTLLQMGTSTASGATQVGKIFLASQKTLDTSGQATLTGHVEDDKGVLWPAWMVRGGDYLTIVDAADTSPRRIVHTSYDDATKANTVQLDQPPQGLQAVLERLAVVIAPLT